MFNAVIGKVSDLCSAVKIWQWHMLARYYGILVSSATR